jgi:XisI protein
VLAKRNASLLRYCCDIVQDLLTQHGQQKISYGDIDTEVIFDRERDHYQVVHVGWDGNQYIYGCAIHIDIKNGKVWIQWNSTEDEIALDLVKAGIPRSDIVLGLQPPELRQYTEYAVS